MAFSLAAESLRRPEFLELAHVGVGERLRAEQDTLGLPVRIGLDEAVFVPQRLDESLEVGRHIRQVLRDPREPWTVRVMPYIVRLAQEELGLPGRPQSADRVTDDTAYEPIAAAHDLLPLSAAQLLQRTGVLPEAEIVNRRGPGYLGGERNAGRLQRFRLQPREHPQHAGTGGFGRRDINDLPIRQYQPERGRELAAHPAAHGHARVRLTRHARLLMPNRWKNQRSSRRDWAVRASRRALISAKSSRPKAAANEECRPQCSSTRRRDGGLK